MILLTYLLTRFVIVSHNIVTLPGRVKRTLHDTV